MIVPFPIHDITVTLLRGVPMWHETQQVNVQCMCTIDGIAYAVVTTRDAKVVFTPVSKLTREAKS